MRLSFLHMAAPPGGSPPSTDRRDTPRPKAPLGGAAARARILHWGFIAGGLVTISDLAGVAFGGGSSTDELGSYLNLFISIGLYWFAGTTVSRETGRITFGVLAGALAGLIDGLVVGASSAMQASAFPDGAPVDVFFQLLWLNLTIALISGAAGAWLSTLTPRRTQ